MVGLGEPEDLLPRADLGGDAVHLVVKDIAEAFGADEGQDVVLVFLSVLGPADGIGSVPNPGFEGFVVLFCHWIRMLSSRRTHNFDLRNKHAIQQTSINHGPEGVRFGSVGPETRVVIESETWLQFLAICNRLAADVGKLILSQ